MPDQLEMNFDASAPITDAEFNLLQRWLDHLDTNTAWVTADESLAALGLLPNENLRRRLRRLAANSDGQIISGQAGYRHIRHATADEIIHASAWLEHQAKLMADRARSIRRRAHLNLVAADVSRI